MKVFVVHIVLQLCILSVIYVYCFQNNKCTNTC